MLAGQREQGETSTAMQACNDWLRMGSGRSIPKLLEQYQQSSAFISNYQPPSASHKTLNTWSSRYHWPDRAADYDAGWEVRKNAERDAVMSYALALDYERVRKLMRLADFLEAQLYAQAEREIFAEASAEPPKSGETQPSKKPTKKPDARYFVNLWVHDVKQIGTGEKSERVDIERFNAPLIEQYRKVLDDIAMETGGRIRRQDITTGGEKVTTPTVYLPAVEDDDG